MTENALDISAPADVIKRFMEKQKASKVVEETVTVPAKGNLKKATKVVEKAPPVSEIQVDTGKIAENSNSVQPDLEVESVTPVIKELPIKKRDRKAYAIAIRAGEATPGNIRAWLKQRGDAPVQTAPEEYRHIIQASSRQTDQDDMSLPENLRLGTYGKANKKWKQIRDKPSTRMVYDDDGNPKTVNVEIEDAAPEAAFDHINQGYEIEDPNAWRSKIYLSAVECEQNNVYLPTPDFPFKQNQLFQNESAMNPGKKRKRKKQQNQADEGHGHQDYPEPAKPKETEPDIPELFGDLPPLPADVTKLPDLTLPLLKGTVIAFKQLGMDERYQPIIVDYRTALVEAS